MKKLLIVSASLLFVAGFISMTWAHGPKGGGSGYRSGGHSKHQFNRPGFSGSRVHFRQHHRHPGYRSFRHFGKRPLSQRLGSLRWRRLPSAGNNVVVIHIPDTLPNRQFQNPLVQPYDDPEPWFLYGHGKLLRSSGIIPPNPQTFSRLR